MEDGADNLRKNIAIKSTGYSLLLVFLSMLISSVVSANESECHRLTSNPNDPESKGQGVPFKEIDAVRGISVCKKALEDNPDSSRILYQLGRAYLKNGEVKKAINNFERAALNDYTFADLALGLVYSSGELVEKNYPRAFGWTKKSAVSGLNPGMHQLALFYLNGDGVSQDVQTAIYWLEKAAKNGFVNSMFLLGDLYYDGEYVEKNEKISFEFYEKAASKNDVTGIYNVAGFHEQGLVVKKT